MTVSEQLSTYPSLNQALTLNCYQLTVFGLGEGQVGSCSESCHQLSKEGQNEGGLGRGDTLSLPVLLRIPSCGFLSPFLIFFGNDIQIQPSLKAELAFCFSRTFQGHNALSRPGVEPGSSDSEPSALTTGLLEKAMALVCPRYC